MKQKAKGADLLCRAKRCKRAILASAAIFALVAMTAPVMAAPGDHSTPASDDPFWVAFANMTKPDDYAGCVTAITNYVNGQNMSDEQKQQAIAGMTQMCSDISTMPSQMETEMTAEGVETSLFDASNWHQVQNLYFQKSENGQPMGRISFSNTIDFMTYRFFNFMNNFGNLVQFNDGYISLNAAMVPDMINYGASFTMYGLHFTQVPDIYVSNGTTMRKAIEGTDVSGIVYDANAGTLTFTPGHFSSFRVVEKGSKLATMKITKVDPRSVKYNARKSTFSINVKGQKLYKKGSAASCMLGFSHATKVSTVKNGKRLKCTFTMSEFSVKGYYPLAISIAGIGEVTKSNAVRIK